MWRRRSLDCGIKAFTDQVPGARHRRRPFAVLQCGQEHHRHLPGAAEWGQGTLDRRKRGRGWHPGQDGRLRTVQSAVVCVP